MSRNLTAEALQALYAQETDKVFLFLLTINHPDLEDPIRVVNNTQDIVSNSQTYKAFPFQIDLPNDNDGVIRTAKLSIDNVDRTIIGVLREIETYPTIELSMIIAGNPDLIEIGPWQFSLRNVQYNISTITGDLMYDDILQIKIPGDLFTPQDFGGLF